MLVETLPRSNTESWGLTPDLVFDPDLLVFDPDLKDARFDVEMEMRRFIRHINIAVAAGEDFAGAVRKSAGELENNLRTYDVEIIKSRPVLPHLNRFGMKGDSLRMVGSSGEPVVDAITGEERNGSVLEASRVIEDFLLAAPNNSGAVLMSPAGWNGFIDEHGEEAGPHLNTETMVFWKDQRGALKGLTLVTDLSVGQSRQAMIELGVSDVIINISEKGFPVPSGVEGDSLEVEGERSERARLADIVRHPVLISFPRSDINPFEYVLDKILAVRGMEAVRLLQDDGTAEIRSIAEIRADIKRFEELLVFSQEEERLVTEPQQFILEEIERLGDKSVQQEIVNKIEKTILMLTKRYLQGINTSRVSFGSPEVGKWILTPRRWREEVADFSAEIAFLKTRSGCPAGGFRRVLRGGSRLGSTIFGGRSFSESDRFGSLEFECPHCKKTNRRPPGKLISHCWHCKANVRC